MQQHFLHFFTFISQSEFVNFLKICEHKLHVNYRTQHINEIICNFSVLHNEMGQINFVLT